MLDGFIDIEAQYIKVGRKLIQVEAKYPDLNIYRCHSASSKRLWYIDTDTGKFIHPARIDKYIRKLQLIELIKQQEEGRINLKPKDIAEAVK